MYFLSGELDTFAKLFTFLIRQEICTILNVHLPFINFIIWWRNIFNGKNGSLRVKLVYKRNTGMMGLYSVVLGCGPLGWLAANNTAGGGGEKEQTMWSSLLHTSESDYFVIVLTCDKAEG